jgi:hypothetical protein
MSAFSKAAGHMLGGGYSPVPLRCDTGLPLVKHWDNLRTVAMSISSIATIIRQHPDAGLAVAGGYRGLVPIDVDTNDPAVIAAVTAVLPEPVVVRLGSKGFVLFYRSEDDIKGRRFIPAGKDAKPLVEVLTRGVVSIPPTLHRKTRKPYRWATKATLFNTRVEELSLITAAHIEALARALEPWCPLKVYTPPAVEAGTPATSDKRMRAWAVKVLANEVAHLSRLASGRNWALYCAGCKLGRYVHHRVLTYREYASALADASKANGYEGKAGPMQVQRTIASAYGKSAGDALPVLRDKPMPARYGRGDRMSAGAIR